MDIKLSVATIIIAAIALTLITALAEIIDRVIFEYFDLDREKISSWLIVAAIGLVAILFIVYIYNWVVE